MNTQSSNTSDRHDPVEALLRQAEPRPAPPDEDERAIRAAVEAEWQSMVTERKSLRLVKAFAIAASIVIAFVATTIMLPSDTLPSVEVARIDKSTGTIHRLGDRAELIDVSDAPSIHSGQVIVTGQDAALGLAWASGGSLRVDADTRIEFIDTGTVFLHEGRVYFDSIGEEADLSIETDFGTVTHLGTQYMAAANRQGLVVSVREGGVRIDGRYYDETATSGKQVEFRGSARPVIVDLPTHGRAWEWAEAMSPGIDLTDRTADRFLQWVGRETGYRISYTTDEARSLAETTRLMGRVEASPRTELRLRMLTTDLDYSFDNDSGVIRVSLAGDGRY